jgi:hypothetical protein
MSTPTVFNVLAQQYRDWCVSHFGASNGLPVANDALRTAKVAVADVAFDTFEPGDYVLVWAQGIVPGPLGVKAQRRLAAWGPTRPLNDSLIEDVQDRVRVIWERA